MYWLCVCVCVCSRMCLTCKQVRRINLNYAPSSVNHHQPQHCRAKLIHAQSKFARNSSSRKMSMLWCLESAKELWQFGGVFISFSSFSLVGAYFMTHRHCDDDGDFNPSSSPQVARLVGPRFIGFYGAWLRMVNRMWMAAKLEMQTGKVIRKANEVR